MIVTTACAPDMQAVLDAMWAHLLPGLGTAAAAGRAAQDQLSSRLQDLRLPACQAGPAPADWAPWTAEPFPIARAGSDTVQPAFLSVGVAPAAGGAQISLTESGNRLTVRVAAGDWAVSDPADQHGATIPVAASGDWLDGSALRAEIIFLETPHRMDITCSLGDHRARATWRHAPLRASTLRDLHCPR